jgi:hypothetical protein
MPLLPRVGEEATHVFLLHIIGDLTLQFVPSGTMKEQTVAISAELGVPTRTQQLVM